MLARPDPKRTLLLICDIQERFRSAIYGFDAMTGTVAKMIKAAQLLEMPVVTTEQNPKALGATVSEIGLANLSGHLNLGVFPKKKFSMIIPEVQAILDDSSKNIESAIIVGIESHVCVLQTALSLLSLEKTVYILADGVSSCNKQEIPIALDRLRQAGAVITTSESILFQLVEDADSPIFRPFAALIKEEKASTASALQTLLDNGIVGQKSPL